MPDDPQATAYDDFDEDAETVFRIFDEGVKMITRRPGSPAVSVGGRTNIVITGTTIETDTKAAKTAKPSGVVQLV